MNQQAVSTTQTIFPALRYSDASAAIAWLERAFDARRKSVYEGPDGLVMHAEVSIAGNLVMFGNTRDDGYPVRSPKDVGSVTASIYVALPDAAAVDALYARAAAAGAEIVRPPYDTDYGSHDFGARDLDGNYWSFGTYRPHAEP
jgi:uncharacterized glyoxalase superfamily protein PhnB